MENIELIKDIEMVKEYYDMPYPPYLHDIDLYESVDYMAGLCNTFIKSKNKNLGYSLNIFAGNNMSEIEHKMLLINSEELNDYYSKMKNVLRILKKYYNEDGTLKKGSK